MQRERKRDGYAILIVLIAVAILLILYATQMKALFLPDNLPPAPTGAEQRPWLLEDQLVGDDETVKQPKSPKPTLEQPIHISAAVSRDGDKRGTVTIDFETNGRLAADWQTAYTQDDHAYTITATLKGNVNVKRTYEDDAGRDKSRLFFIARGDYLKQADGGQTGIPDEAGQAWIIGWLSPDDHAIGHITLTTDRHWSAVYDFDTEDGTATD